MRIIFISPHCDPQATLGEPDAGGQCVYEHELAIKIAGAGHEVLTFCRQRNGFLPITKVVPGYTIYRITADGNKFVPKEIIAKTIPKFVEKMAKLLDEKYNDSIPTVIHSHYWDGAMAALLLKANIHDYPLVWTPHSLGFSKRDKYKGIGNESVHHFIPRLLWENYVTTISDKIICSTRYEKRELIKHYNTLPQNIEIIPPGLTIGSSEKSEAFRRLWNIDSETKVFLCLGRMARTKGYQHAIRIMHELKNRITEKYVLVIIGGGTKIKSEEESQYLNELKRLATYLGVRDRVIFHPSVPHEEVQSIYSCADFYLMTAEEEPFGLTVIEAMAAKCVVISHNRGGTQHIIGKNNVGYVVDMHKYRIAADLIADILRNPSKMKRTGERARAAVVSKYSWESRIPNYLKIYQEQINSEVSRLSKVLRTDSFFKSISLMESKTQVTKIPEKHTHIYTRNIIVPHQLIQ